MQVNITKLEALAKEKNWSIPELAKRLNIDYSHLYRILNRKKNGGAKLFTGLYSLCKKEGLNIDDYIFLPEPLSANKDIKKVVSNYLD